MEVFLLAFMRPIIQVALFGLVTFWVMRVVWELLAGFPKIRAFLFKRRGL